MLVKLQQEVPLLEVNSILGSWKDCQLGEDLIIFLQVEFGYSEMESKAFLNYLLSNNYLKPIPGSFASYNPFKKHFHWVKFTLESDNEAFHIKMQREADRMEWEFSRKVKAAESVRLKLDLSMREYTNLIQEFFFDHFKNMKETLQACMQLEALPNRAIKDLATNVSNFIEFIDPEKELNKIVEIEKTGFQPLQTLCYRSFSGRYYGVS